MAAAKSFKPNSARNQLTPVAVKSYFSCTGPRLVLQTEINPCHTLEQIALDFRKNTLNVWSKPTEIYMEY